MRLCAGQGSPHNNSYNSGATSARRSRAAAPPHCRGVAPVSLNWSKKMVPARGCVAATSTHTLAAAPSPSALPPPSLLPSATSPPAAASSASLPARAAASPPSGLHWRHVSACRNVTAHVRRFGQLVDMCAWDDALHRCMLGMHTDVDTPPLHHAEMCLRGSVDESALHDSYHSHGIKNSEPPRARVRRHACSARWLSCMSRP